MIWFMITLLLTSTIALTLGVALCIGKLKNNPLSKYVRRLLSCASGVTLFNVVAMMTPNKKLALALFAVYNIFEALTMVAMLSYVCAYTGKQRVIRTLRKPFFIFMIFDSLVMLVNIFWNFAFEVERVADDFGNCFYRSYNYSPIYLLHTAFVVFIITIALFLLVYKMLKSPRAYLPKYSTIFILMSVLTAISMFHMFIDFQFDYSIGLYSIMGILIFYYTLIYVPRGLMDKLMIYTFSNMKDGIICVDIDGNLAHTNVAAMDFCSADESIETVEKQIVCWEMERFCVVPYSSTHEVIRKINGEKHYFTVEYKEIYDDFLKKMGYFYLIHDRTEEYKKYESEKYRATHDALTGLYNKEYFYEIVGKILRKYPDVDYNIIVTDVKNFKIVNDVFGVDAGDSLLIRIAEITQNYGKDFCVYARLTGDRFALCIPRLRYSEENLLACYSMVDSFFENSSFKTHIHIGVYEVDNRNLRVSVMCDHARLAIRTIKDSFGSRVAYYKRELRENFISRHRIISEFEVAIAKGQFRGYIQPQVKIDGSIRGGEMLVRWFHPDDGMIRPDTFIHVLEETGLVGRLDKHMWELACKQLRKWTDWGSKKCYLSINISKKDFMLLDVYETLTTLVNKYEIEPKRLHLEITETAIMNSETHLELIGRLRKFGFLVEIDDFGSGYSSLNMLKDFEADVIKIDMGFLQNTENVSKSKTILKMIISLAKELKMEVITEGVDNLEQIRFLTEYGCDIFQGYYFAKPMAVENFERNYLNKKFRMNK